MYLTVDTENDDGSANCSVDLSHDEANYLINYAINDIMAKGIRCGKDVTVEKRDLEEHVIVDTLKHTLITTYLYKWEADDDIIHNMRVRRGCKALLRHFMVPQSAEKYIAQVEAIHEGGDDE